MLVIWCGPVQASTLELAKWPGSPPHRVVTVGAGAGGKIGSSAFQQLAADYAKKAGTPLRGLLAAHGIAADGDEPVMLCGFSAGYGLIEPILASTEDAARVRAVGAFDAYYTSAAKTPKPGFLAFLRAAAMGQRALLMTSSHVAGPDYPSGADAARALVAASGVRLEYVDQHQGDVGPASCEQANAAGAFRWFVYRDRTDEPNALRKSHVQHATVLAPHFAPELLADWGASSVSSSGGGGGVVALGAAALLAAHQGWI